MLLNTDVESAVPKRQTLLDERTMAELGTDMTSPAAHVLSAGEGRESAARSNQHIVANAVERRRAHRGLGVRKVVSWSALVRKISGHMGSPDSSPATPASRHLCFPQARRASQATW